MQHLLKRIDEYKSLLNRMRDDKALLILDGDIRESVRAERNKIEKDLLTICNTILKFEGYRHPFNSIVSVSEHEGKLVVIGRRTQDNSMKPEDLQSRLEISREYLQMEFNALVNLYNSMLTEKLRKEAVERQRAHEQCQRDKFFEELKL